MKAPAPRAPVGKPLFTGTAQVHDVDAAFVRSVRL
jgi:hypothetical protein